MKAKKIDPIYKLLNAVVDETVLQEDRKPEFRVSSLPYCSILDAETKLLDEMSESNFEFDFYTGIGTEIHRLLQIYIPMVEKRSDFRVYGKWQEYKYIKDEKTGKRELKKTKLHGPCFLNKSLRKLLKAGKLEYVEMSFTYKNKQYKASTLSGHLDLLVMDNKGKNGRWHALEFKSTSSFIITDRDTAIKRGYFPQKKHQVQISTYCTLLHLCHNIKVNSYYIIYFSRNKIQERPTQKSPQEWAYHPFKFKFTKEEYNLRKEHILNSQSGLEAVTNFVAYTGSNIEKQYKLAKEVVKNKPCKKKEDYNKVMFAAFGFDNPVCPYYKNGSCFRKGSMEKHLVEYRDTMGDEND